MRVINAYVMQGKNANSTMTSLFYKGSSSKVKWPLCGKGSLPNGIMTIRNLRTSNEFKVNDQCLKHFIERFET